jgi:hypothetical protein
MMQKNAVGAVFAIVMVLAFGLACSALSDDTEKANKLIDEGNAASSEGMKLMTDAQSKLTAMTDGKNVANAPKIAPDLIKVFDQAEEQVKTAAGKFDEASKLKVDEKFKDYLVAKAKEFNKRAEVIEALKALPNIVLEFDAGRSVTSQKQLDDLKSKINAANDKAEKLSDEADELAKQSQKIQDDNPTIFKH